LPLSLSLDCAFTQSSSSAADGFHPNKSKVSTDTMETWKNSEISGDLTQVPGIGPAAASKLAGEGITNVRELCRILSPVLGAAFFIAAHPLTHALSPTAHRPTSSSASTS
jgi:hypothetical protein